MIEILAIVGWGLCPLSAILGGLGVVIVMIQLGKIGYTDIKTIPNVQIRDIERIVSREARDGWSWIGTERHQVIEFEGKNVAEADLTFKKRRLL